MNDQRSEISNPNPSPLMRAFAALRPSSAAFALVVLALVASGCDAVFGSKDDPTTREIFEEGETDPSLLEDVGYVPLTPFYEQGFGGTFDQPVDVYVGYDEFIYVADNRGLHVLDLAGRPQFLLDTVAGQDLRDITAIVQDRRLDVYIAARRDTTVAGAECPSSGGGEACDLAVVYRVRGLTTNTPRVVDILWHPFDDGSRRFTRFGTPDVYAGGASDEDAEFTGVATLADNSLYVTRRGPVNNTASGRPSQAFSPFNAFLQYTAEGEYIQYVRTLTPDRASLLSAYYPADVLTFIGPPQRSSPSTSVDFMLALAPPPDQPAPDYGVVSIVVAETPDGTEYRVDAARLGASGSGVGDGSLFEIGQFERVSSLAYAPDQTGYTFVLDAGKDSLFVFNSNGIEGVAPPPGAGSTDPVRASFGGTGGGPLQFSDPEGVAYYNQVVYVADTGNNRISRFRLNTDFE